jgi:hypothetical protein
MSTQRPKARQATPVGAGLEVLSRRHGVSQLTLDETV